MSKYIPLKSFLDSTPLDRVQMSFKEVEQVLGFKLPASALRHRPWWSNSVGAHVQSEAWLKAGFETESVDMDARRLVFRRKMRVGSPSSASNTKGPRPSFNKVYGSLSGTIVIHDDITRPIEETWVAEAGRI